MAVAGGLVEVLHKGGYADDLGSLLLDAKLKEMGVLVSEWDPNTCIGEVKISTKETKDGINSPEEVQA